MKRRWSSNLKVAAVGVYSGTFLIHAMKTVQYVFTSRKQTIFDVQNTLFHSVFYVSSRFFEDLETSIILVALVSRMLLLN